MSRIEDEFLMSPNEGLAAVANIFAAGILRLHTRQALPTSASPADEMEPDSHAACLEVPEETVLTVHTS